MRINEGNPVGTTTFSRQSMTTSTGSSGDDSSTIPGAPLPLTIFSIEDCVYKGEGNANVVIALPQERKVIRFRKSIPGDVSPDGGKQRAEREVKFVRFVASCFLSPYTEIPEILNCDMNDVTRLSRSIRAFRPDKRCDKEIVETYATKYPDYTFLRIKVDSNLFRSKKTFCVEIKPKQGYIQDSDWKFQKCPYCLTQYHKLKKKVIMTNSTYCPFDLFSGKEERMESALKGLLKSPQNNLRIFKDGIMVYDQKSSTSDLECVLEEWFQNSDATTNEDRINKFCNLICAALLHPFSSKELKSNSTYNLYSPIEHDLRPASRMNQDIIIKAKKLLYFAGAGCNMKGATLPINSVLELILRMQKLPFISLEYVYNTYIKYRSFITDDIIYCSLLKTHKPDEHRICFCKQKDVESNESVDCLSKLRLSPAQCKKNNLLCSKSTIIHNEENKHCNNEKEAQLMNTKSLTYLQNYLLFSCARDCSILMAFREINPTAVALVPEENVLQLPDGLSFVCDIGISDLDPKSLRCIEKHRQRDIDVLNSVICTLDEELTIKS